MNTEKWKFDSRDVSTHEGAFVKWYDERFFLIIHNGIKFYGELLSDHSESNELTIKINHRVFQLKRKGELDELIASLGMDKPKVKKLNQLKSPMPGRVLKIFIQKGDEIDLNQNLLSLEAMKMENIIKAEGVGTVKEIKIQEGQVVDKGMVLIEFD